VSSAVSSAIEALPEGRKLRMLEVGAGTGGTTAFLLDLLPQDRVEYVFTDIGPLFTSKARAKFARHSFMRYEILDIERDPREQGFTAHQFDIVLAANVLHATTDLKRTLEHVKTLLAPQGLLVLLEATEAQRWVDLVFGLTEGWWKFKDTALRPGHPLLSEPQWLELLSAAGFTGVVGIPGGDEIPEVQGQTILVARNNAETVRRSKVDGCWIILADSSGIGTSLGERLREDGDDCYTVRPGDRYERTGEHEFMMDPRQAGDYSRLLRELAEGHGCQGVVHLWSVDDWGTEPSAGELKQAQERGSRSVLYMCQALARLETAPVPRLWLVTQKTQRVDGKEGGLGVTHAPIWGLAKTIAMEHRALRAVRVDIGDEGDAGLQSEHLRDEICFGDAEDQVAFRNGVRYVARLLRQAAAGEAIGAVRLEKGRGGGLEELALRPAARRAPGRGEIEIRVRAAGLNFRDVLNALGMYPGEAGPLGNECAGEVVAIGEGVEGIAVGDAVVAISAGTFAGFTTAQASFVVAKPTPFSFEQAATIPIAFLTAGYALEHIGRLCKGERILIHAAAGGVGLAAVQLAQRAGAEIFATAGSGEKREFLRSLGIAHVMD
jgi:hypothetical protein